MLALEPITVPTLLLDEARARANIRRMAAKATRAGARLRPHFKTHQSAVIGQWFREAGVEAITVSSLRMADYFASPRDGCAAWEDITVAFPLNVRELACAASLARRARLGLLVESAEAIEAAGQVIDAPVGVWLEVDTGYLRSGVDAAQTETFVELCAAVQRFPHFTVRGLLTHTGHSYTAGHDLQALHAQTLGALLRLRGALAARGIGPLEISIGDTPIASVVEDLAPVDELRPGNFVFYDWMQHQIGACQEEDIAVAVACPVVARYPQRHEIALYGGAVHLSKESVRLSDGSPDFGHVAPLGPGGWGAAFPGVYLRSVSQEHGIVRATPEAYDRWLAPLAVGDLVAVLPIHSCLTADLLKKYMTLDGTPIGMMGPSG